MPAILLDGKGLSREVFSSLRAQVEVEIEKGKRKPGLGVILVGDDPASKVYIAGKERAAQKCNFSTFEYLLPKQSSHEEVARVIKELNNDPAVDGILLQLPLPSHLNPASLLNLINADKDADALTAISQGRLIAGDAKVEPCTPKGVLRLIDRALGKEQDSLAGKRAVVIGRSILVGKPLSLMLLSRDATVTIAHSKSKDLPAVCREADILVAAVGRPKLVKEDWVKEGAVVIDVGISREESGRIVGDVDFDSVSVKASAITPVPGGVGPMTIAMLMTNTFDLYMEHVSGT